MDGGNGGFDFSFTPTTKARPIAKPKSRLGRAGSAQPRPSTAGSDAPAQWAPQPQAPASFSFGGNNNASSNGSGGGGFNFSVNNTASNPFSFGSNNATTTSFGSNFSATESNASGGGSFVFGAGNQNGATGDGSQASRQGSPFTFGQQTTTAAPQQPAAAPVFNFGGAGAAGNIFSNTASNAGSNDGSRGTSPFNFPAATQAQASNNLFGQAPAAQSNSLFGGNPSVPSNNLFAQSQPSTTPNLFGQSAPAPASNNIFSNTSFSANSAEPEAKKPVFSFGQSTTNAQPSSSNNLFANPSPSPQPSSTPLFGGQGANATAAANLFNQNKEASPAPSFTFGQQQNKDPSPAPSFVFGQQQNKEASPAPPNLFGQQKESTPSFTFGQQPSESKPEASTNIFAPKPDISSNIFAPKADSAPGASLFGSTTPASAPAATSALFGSTTPAPAPAASTSLFGSTTPAPAPSSLFGQSAAASSTPAPTSSLFGNKPAAAPVSFSFGQNATESQESKDGASSATLSQGTLFGSSQPTTASEPESVETPKASQEKPAAMNIFNSSFNGGSSMFGMQTPRAAPSQNPPSQGSPPKRKNEPEPEPAEVNGATPSLKFAVPESGSSSEDATPEPSQTTAAAPKSDAGAVAQVPSVNLGNAWLVTDPSLDSLADWTQPLRAPRVSFPSTFITKTEEDALIESLGGQSWPEEKRNGAIAAHLIRCYNAQLGDWINKNPEVDPTPHAVHFTLRREAILQKYGLSKNDAKRSRALEDMEIYLLGYADACRRARLVTAFQAAQVPVLGSLQAMHDNESPKVNGASDSGLTNGGKHHAEPSEEEAPAKRLKSGDAGSASASTPSKPAAAPAASTPFDKSTLANSAAGHTPFPKAAPAPAPSFTPVSKSTPAAPASGLFSTTPASAAPASGLFSTKPTPASGGLSSSIFSPTAPSTPSTPSKTPSKTPTRDEKYGSATANAFQDVLNTPRQSVESSSSTQMSKRKAERQLTKDGPEDEDEDDAPKISTPADISKRKILKPRSRLSSSVMNASDIKTPPETSPQKPARAAFGTASNTPSGASTPRSILEQPTPELTASNIFGHLSGANRPDTGDDDDDDEDAEDDEESSKTPAKDATVGKSLFDRVSRDNSEAGSDKEATPKPASIFSGLGTPKEAPSTSIFSGLGTPKASTGGLASSIFSSGAGTPKPTASIFGTPKPSDNTWKPDTPLKFGASTTSPAAPASSLFGNTAGAPSPTFKFGGTTTSTPGSSIFASAATSQETSRATSPGTGAATPENGSNDPDAEHHEQVDLTSGGAGEENDDILHTVKARASMYVDKEWKVKGTGIMRILQNKETKATRIVLRLDPSGAVIMNKALLPGAKYEAVKKNVKLIAAADQGEGVESWLLTVKTEDSAADTAKVMEDNKAAAK